MVIMRTAKNALASDNINTKKGIKKMEWEKCKNCFLCFTDEGESGWYCTATNEELETYDDLPCICEFTKIPMED